jgi:hypothetical protein
MTGKKGVKKLEAIDRYIGQLLFKVLVHEVFILVFGVAAAAGPAA